MTLSIPECHYAGLFKCYAECRYAECRGANKTYSNSSNSSPNKNMKNNCINSKNIFNSYKTHKENAATLKCFISGQVISFQGNKIVRIFYKDIAYLGVPYLRKVTVNILLQI